MGGYPWGTHGKELYEEILGIEGPWEVSNVELEDGTVRVQVGVTPGRRLVCPECGGSSPGYDKRRRFWRHLDTCQFKTLVEAYVPRVKCPKHGVVQVAVPWAEPGSGFTALMEALIIEWLKEASTLAVARLMDLTWDQVDGVMQRAVKRGLDRREDQLPTRIRIDETSFQKRHEYVTVVSDQETGKVLYVADDRTKESLEGFFEDLQPADLIQIESVSMDMRGPYIAVVEGVVHDAEEKICFDKLHVAKHLGDAVNKVRSHEQRELARRGRHGSPGRSDRDSSRSSGSLE